MDIYEFINEIDKGALRKSAQNAKPFEYFSIDNFLKSSFAGQVLKNYPSYDSAKEIGREFSAVNESKKIQITDSNLFPEPIKILNEIFLSKQFLNLLSYVFNVPDLISDPKLDGGGMHETDEDVKIRCSY